MASLLKCVMMFQVYLRCKKVNLSASLLTLPQNHVIPPQAGMPHALNSRYPDLSKLKIEISSERKDYISSEWRPRRALLNNFDAAVCYFRGEQPGLTLLI